MSDDQILGTALSMWMGFAAALQVHTQMAQDKVLSGTLRRMPLVVARLIYFGTGLAGALGFSWLIGHVIEFSGAVFPVGFITGVVLFVLTRVLSGKANGDAPYDK